MTVSQAKEMYPWLTQFDDRQIWIHDGIITIDEGSDADYTFEEIDTLSEPYRIQSQPDSSEEDQQSREDQSSEIDSSEEPEESREDTSFLSDTSSETDTTDTQADSSSEAEQGSSNIDTAFSYEEDAVTVLVSQPDFTPVIEELQRIEGVGVTLLYCIAFGAAFVIAYWFFKIWNYFTR